MAKIFLDTNILIRIMEDDLPVESKQKIDKYHAYLSVLSVHIATYVHKIKLPSERFNMLLGHFKTLSLTTTITEKSLAEPTPDFEDNVQLNTAVTNGISTFVTLDKELLQMRNYKSMKIVSPQEL